MIPAIYHLEAKVITRGVGRSAVAASAYMSCSEITNEYDGVKHDYTKKGGLVYEKIFLPSHAPPEWCDRSKLWNAVEETEKTRDSRLAREFIVALPVEVSRERQIAEAEEFAKALVDDGMCVDVCIHDTGGGNPHAHIMASVRPLNPDGTWQRKTEKEYLYIRDGKEQGFTASEFLCAKNEGWEKQYQYYVDGKKVYLPPSQADGYERVNKYPKSTKYGRQNPISERWNSDEQLCKWRKLWADIVNRDLEEKNIEPIDHRSFAARGILLQPTIHEGVSSKKMKKKGKITQRMRINILIRKDNSLILRLRKTIQALTDLVVTAGKLLLPALADALEGIRVSMIILDCQRKSINRQKNKAVNAVRDADEFYIAFRKLQEDIKTTELKLKETQKKLKLTPKVMKQKYNEVRYDVGHLEFELKELNFKMKNILSQNDCETEQEILDLKPQFEEKRNFEIPHLEAEEKRMDEEIETALAQYHEKEKEAESLDKEELTAERMKIRPEKETEARKVVEAKVSDISEYDFNHSVDEYEVISGHRRLHAAVKAGIKEVPAFIYAVSRDEAAVMLVDSNLHREKILPSERAFAYKLKYEALKHQGVTCGQVGHKSRDDVSDTESGRQVQRYIRLTNLIPELLDLMDEGKIAFSVGVELSYLDDKTQYDLLRVIEEQDCTPSYSQAWHMHKDFNEGTLTAESIENTLSAEKPNQKEYFKLPLEQVQKFYPKANKEQLEDYVMKALDYYNKALQRQRNRDRSAR